MYFETRLLKIKEKNRLAVFSKKKTHPFLLNIVYRF